MNGAKGKQRFRTHVLNTDAGQSVFVRSCNLIGDLEPMYKHESIGKLLYQIWRIMNECPELFPEDNPNMTEMPTVEEHRAFAQHVLNSPELSSQLVALFYDDGSDALALRAPLPSRLPPPIEQSPSSSPGAISSTPLCCARWATSPRVCLKTARRPSSTAA